MATRLPPLNCAWCGQFIHDGHSPACVMGEDGKELAVDGENVIICQQCVRRGRPPRKRRQQGEQEADR